MNEAKLMQGLTLSDPQVRLLGSIFERGAEAASRALTQWLGRPVHLKISAVEQVNVLEVSGMLGPEDSTVAVCAMGFAGELSGKLLLVFSDEVGLSLVDILLQQKPGTTTQWTELETSAACETANIVGCAYLNALSWHIPDMLIEPSLIPTPPEFRHEYAASLIDFALMEQASQMERVLLVKSRFHTDQTELDWHLLFVPDPESLRLLAQIQPTK